MTYGTKRWLFGMGFGMSAGLAIGTGGDGSAVMLAGMAIALFFGDYLFAQKHEG